MKKKRKNKENILDPEIILKGTMYAYIVLTILLFIACIIEGHYLMLLFMVGLCFIVIAFANHLIYQKKYITIIFETIGGFLLILFFYILTRI